jgi:hypothetical protein
VGVGGRYVEIGVEREDTGDGRRGRLAVTESGYWIARHHGV